MGNSDEFPSNFDNLIREFQYIYHFQTNLSSIYWNSLIKLWIENDKYDEEGNSVKNDELVH